MNINCNAWNPGMQETMRLARWLVLENYNEPLNAADHAIDSVITTLKVEGCNPDVKTTITLPLDEYRLLISDAQKKAKEEGCKEGREEAWDLARRIGTCGHDCYDYDEAHDVFENRTFGQILRLPVEEVLAKDKEHQEDKKALHVGDEVEFDTKLGVASITAGEKYRGYINRGYITHLVSPNLVRVLTKEIGTIPADPKNCKKTGRHSDEIEKAMTSF